MHNDGTVSRKMYQPARKNKQTYIHLTVVHGDTVEKKNALTTRVCVYKYISIFLSVIFLVN